MNRIYVILADQLPDGIGYLEVIEMNEEQVKKLPHEFFNFNEFENEWNADISGAFASSEQFVRIF